MHQRTVHALALVLQVRNLNLDGRQFLGQLAGRVLLSRAAGGAVLGRGHGGTSQAQQTPGSYSIRYFAGGFTARPAETRPSSPSN